jgi:hypothetical protein
VSNETEIVRTVQIEGKTVHIHIRLTEDEIRRLVLPHVVSAFASESRARNTQYVSTSANGTVAYGAKRVSDQ